MAFQSSWMARHLIVLMMQSALNQTYAHAWSQVAGTAIGACLVVLMLGLHFPQYILALGYSRGDTQRRRNLSTNARQLLQDQCKYYSFLLYSVISINILEAPIVERLLAIVVAAIISIVMIYTPLLRKLEP